MDESLEKGLLDASRLDEILSAEAMTRGGIVGGDERAVSNETRSASKPGKR